GPANEARLERLRRAGLSRYESLVYLGLVQDRNARVVEIARRTGVPQPKVYQALDSLVEKGFCAVGADAINRYRPIAPELALQGQQKRLGEQQAEVLALSQELAAVYNSGAEEQRWAPPVEIVKGLPQIRAVLVEQVRQARSEILYFGQSPQVPSLEVAQALWERAEAGVGLRLVFDERYFEGGELRGEEDDLLRKVKGERRRIAALPSKMIVVDRGAALISIARAGTEGLFLLVLRQEGLVTHCRTSFEHTWARASAF
ncbi:MAG: helix-turn-helix domain-containing protein, partial [Planctomycetes bacterium]|nr:helix-turn-helix domain-containing protein [Planctomycetota bacterium]